MRHLIASLCSVLVLSSCSPSDGRGIADVRTPVLPSANPTGCALDPALLARIYRGHHDVHSEDVTIVPEEPNYWGSFDVVSHSGPWDYLQNVPLVLYGPGRVVAQGQPLDSEAHITDVYPTLAEMLGVELRDRPGVLLSDAVASDRPPTPPKLVVTIVWDGGGRNMLQRWPDRWPTLARLEREGTSYLNAEVGSSPSITPATHASLGTGAYPNTHGVTAIDYRVDADTVRTAFENSDPRDLKLTTYADQIDKLYDNRSKVGLLAWRDWHMPMLGHGSMTPGGDKDQLALIGETGSVTGKRAYYSTPDYLKGQGERFLDHVYELDREDGVIDGQWRGHDIAGAYEDNPAYVRFQGDLAIKMLKRGKYGLDAIPDLWFANFKQTDIAGHRYSIDSPEVADVLEETDRELGRIVRYLERAVGDYVLVLTADHGHTRDATKTGAWPIGPSEARADLYKAFGIPQGEVELFASTSGVGPFLNRAVATRYGVTARELAAFFSDYTIRDNWPSDENVPDGYRGAEKVFAAAWAAEDFDEVMACAFGPSGKPPPRGS